MEGIPGLFRAGLTFLYINLYDNAEQDGVPGPPGAGRAGRAQYRLRDHWVGASQDFGLNLNNRSGMVAVEQVRSRRTPQALAGQPCLYPFYKMLVDWDGRVLFCSNDWGRKIVVGDVTKTSVSEIWLSRQMRAIRERLGVGDRTVSPCNSCNVRGDLHGRFSYDLLRDHYRQNP